MTGVAEDLIGHVVSRMNDALASVLEQALDLPSP